MEISSEVVAALAGAFTAGVLAYVAGWARHRLDSSRRDQEWFREKLLESYSNCIYYLVKLSMRSLERDKTPKDVRQQFSEAQRYMIRLRTYQADFEKAEQLKRQSKLLSDAWNKTTELADIADETIELVKRYLEEDLKAHLPSSPSPSTSGGS